MTLPLMPKATAVWLVENTSLTFEQIAEFCGMHALEVQGIADGEVAIGIQGLDPIANGQLTRAEIEACEADPSARLKMIESEAAPAPARGKGARYTPVSKRQDKPDAIAWLLRHHADIGDPAIARLVGTTKSTIQKVRDRTHWDIQNIKPRNPVSVGLCSQDALDNAIRDASMRRARAEKKAARAKARAAREKAAAAEAAQAAQAAAQEAKVE